MYPCNSCMKKYYAAYFTSTVIYRIPALTLFCPHCLRFGGSHHSQRFPYGCLMTIYLLLLPLCLFVVHAHFHISFLSSRLSHSIQAAKPFQFTSIASAIPKPNSYFIVSIHIFSFNLQITILLILRVRDLKQYNNYVNTHTHTHTHTCLLYTSRCV